MCTHHDHFVRIKDMDWTNILFLGAGFVLGILFVIALLWAYLSGTEWYDTYRRYNPEHNKGGYRNYTHTHTDIDCG